MQDKIPLQLCTDLRQEVHVPGSGPTDSRELDGQTERPGSMLIHYHQHVRPRESFESRPRESKLPKEQRGFRAAVRHGRPPTSHMLSVSGEMSLLTDPQSDEIPLSSLRLHEPASHTRTPEYHQQTGGNPENSISVGYAHVHFTKSDAQNDTQTGDLGTPYMFQGDLFDFCCLGCICVLILGRIDKSQNTIMRV